MRQTTFERLEVGDIVRHVGTHETFIITANYRTHITAVRTVEMTHPSEWGLVVKSRHETPGPQETA